MINSTFTNDIISLSNHLLLQNRTTVSYKCDNNPEWTMKFISRNCDQIMESSPEDFMIRRVSFGKLINKEEVDNVWNCVQSALVSQLPYQLIYRITTIKKSEKLLFEQGQGIFDNYGQLIELSGFITDISKEFKSNEDIHCNLRQCINEIVQNAFALKLIKNRKFVPISEREATIAIYFCYGMSMKEIGRRVNISYRTVEVHLRSIKSKLGCHTKSELRNIISKSLSCKNFMINE